MFPRVFRRMAAFVQKPRRRVIRSSAFQGESLESRALLSGVNPTAAAVVGAVQAGDTLAVGFEVGPIGTTSGQRGFDVGPIGRAGARGFETGPIGRVDIDAHTGAHASGMSSSAMPVPDVVDRIGYIWGPHGHLR